MFDCSAMCLLFIDQICSFQEQTVFEFVLKIKQFHNRSDAFQFDTSKKAFCRRLSLSAASFFLSFAEVLNL